MGFPDVDSIVLTCEHGGHRVPAPYRPLFRGADRVLESHRGWDPGALELARGLARRLDAPLFPATVSRLVVELNRSLGHPRFFSEFTRGLDREASERLIEEHWHPYRRTVEDAIRAAEGRVLHLSVHSFTPVLDGEVRRADVGLLYDPSRPAERDFCVAWQADLRRRLPGLAILRNVPYRGTSDGFTTHLRRRLSPSQYLGIELEVNQKYPLGDRATWRTVRRAIEASLAGPPGATP